MSIFIAAYRYIIRHAEFLAVVFLLMGIITFNKQFVYIGIGNLYITEFIAVLIILVMITKYAVSGKVNSLTRSDIRGFLTTFWPLILLMIYAMITIYLDRSYGFQTVRHGMIFLYTILFLLLFTFSIENTKQLYFILFYLIVVFSPIFNGVKFIIYKYLDYSFHYEEQERVMHNETDIICASLSLLGIMVYHNFFWRKSKLLTFTLVTLNLLIIILAVKRSALAGLLPAIFLYLLLIRKSFNYKKLIKVALLLTVPMLGGWIVWYFIDHESWTQYQGYFVNKFSFNERNASWRWEAWELAFDKFLASPYFGIGYGEDIITYPLKGTDTHDPHNSVLAFLVRHGMIMFAVFVFFIAYTYKSLLHEIKNTNKDNPEYYLSLFLILGLTTMIVFSFFNVVLENQYEGIFFQLFLCGVYVLRKQHIPFFRMDPTKIEDWLSRIAIGMVTLFLVVAATTHDKDRIPIYSSKTNSSLPIPFEGGFNNLEVLPIKDNGITFRLLDSNEYTKPVISWFFPPQALDVSLDQYHVIVEFDHLIEGASFILEYEDGYKESLVIEKKNNQMIGELNGISPLHEKAKIKLFTLEFPSFEMLIVKNIYLEKR